MKAKILKVLKCATETKVLLVVIVVMQLYLLARIDDVESVAYSAYDSASEVSSYDYEMMRKLSGIEVDVSDLEDSVNELRYR